MKHLQEAIRLDSNEKVKDVSREERADHLLAVESKLKRQEEENYRLKVSALNYLSPFGAF